MVCYTVLLYGGMYDDRMDIVYPDRLRRINQIVGQWSTSMVAFFYFQNVAI